MCLRVIRPRGDGRFVCGGRFGITPSRLAEPTAIVVRLRTRRVDLQCAPTCVERDLEFVDLKRRDGNVQVGVPIVGPQLDRPPRGRDRLAKATAAPVGLAQIRMGLRDARREAQRLFKHGDRRVVSLQIDEDRRDVGIDWGKIRLRADRRCVRAQRVVEATGLPVQYAEITVCLREVRGDRDRRF
jgi:hypothetical protein